MTLADAVREAGVVGAGGAGFPTHVKLAAHADTFIANGAECEPCLVTDQWVTLANAEAILWAIRAAADAVGARRRVLAVKNNYHPVIDRVRPLLKDGPEVELFLLEDFYPAGDEHVTVHEVTGRVVPEGGIPPEVGVVVDNVATLLNVRRAAQGIPVTTRPITVTGEVARPGVYEAPIGTSAAEVIAAAGGALSRDVEVVEGGPMMGWLIPSLAQPVTKTTSGYLVLPDDHPVVRTRRIDTRTEMRRATAGCCQCRICTDLCPRALLGHRIAPHLAMRAALSAWDVPPELEAMSFLCSQCGVCDQWSCPLGLSPRRIFAEYRGRCAARKATNPYRNRTQALDSQKWARPPKPRLALRLGLSSYLLPHEGAIQRVPDPYEVVLPLKQHIGAPARPTVKAGDRVRLGDVVGEIPEGALGARVHASMDGVVSHVDGASVRIERAP